MSENIRFERRKLILHPLRLRLLTELAGRCLTAGQLAKALPDVARATLYRHLGRLAEAGILEVVSERKVRGVTERTYAVAEGQSRLSADELRDMTPEQHLEAFEIFQAALAHRLARHVRDTEPERIASGGLSYNATAVYVDEEERRELAARFARALEGFTDLGPGPGRRRFTLASVVIPGAEDDRAQGEAS